MQSFLVESKMTEFTRNNTDAAQNAHPDVSSPRCGWGASEFRSKEDETSFRRWRIGFFVFYGVTAMLLGGLAVATDRQATFANVTKSNNPALASADLSKRR